MRPTSDGGKLLELYTRHEWNEIDLQNVHVGNQHAVTGSSPSGNLEMQSPSMEL